MYVISKQEAQEQGLIFYFTGKPCKHGHISERLVKGGSCRVCKNLTGEKHRKENREEYNQYCRDKKRETYSSEKRREQYIRNIFKEKFYAAKSRAKDKGLAFTITIDDVIIPDRCPVFGVEFDYSDRLLTPSLDRIVNEKGYVKGNVQVISMKANMLKNNSTIEELKLILQYMEKS